MKINQIINETTTSGSVATVDSPIGATQSRGNPSIYGGKKVGSMFKGKKTNKPFANSLTESQMKDLAYDLENMRPAEFLKKYKKTREELKAAMSKQPQPAVNEAELQEDDIIMVPGQGKRLKPGFIAKSADRTDHEVEMARSDLFSAAKNAQKVFAMIKDMSEEEGLEGWVQEKIIKANDYLNTVREYLEGKQVQGVAEADKHSFVGKIQRGHELKKKVDSTFKDIGNAQTKGDKEAGSKAFRKHERYANLERPGTWTKSKEQGVAEGFRLRGTGNPGMPTPYDQGQADAKKGRPYDNPYDQPGEEQEHRNYRKGYEQGKQQGVAEGAKVDRMVKHVAQSEKKLGHSKKEAENIAWATANKRGMLDNKNKKK